MNLRVILLLVLALGAAAATTFYVREWLQSERTEQQQQQAEAPKQDIPDEEVLVAAQDLDPGTILQPSDLTWQAWPKPRISGRYVVQSQNEQGLEEAVGGVIRQPLVSGTPISEAMYVKPGDRGFLAAILKPGKRAITLPVNNAAVLSGLVFPGDHVDIILSHTVQASGQTNGSVQASETVLSDVRVLALDQRVSNPDNEPQGAQTVTFEVTPKQAEQLSVAQQLGELRLSLRSIADGRADPSAPGETPSFTLSNEVSRLLGERPQEPSEPADQTSKSQPFTVQIIRGTNSQERSFDDRATDRESPDGQAEARQNDD